MQCSSRWSNCKWLILTSLRCLRDMLCKMRHRINKHKCLLRMYDTMKNLMLHMCPGCTECKTSKTHFQTEKSQKRRCTRRHQNSIHCSLDILCTKHLQQKSKYFGRIESMIMMSQFQTEKIQRCNSS